MTHSPEHFTIGAFAKAAGVNVETIRFYQRKGLLSEPKKLSGGIRRYGAVDLSRLKFVKSAQRLGFSLDEVAQLLKLEDGTHCNETAKFAAHHLADVRAKLANLRRVEATLSKLVKACSAHPDNVSCPLIAALH